MAEAKGNPRRALVGYTVGNYLIRGIGFLTLPLFSRLLTTEDFGLYSVFTSYESIVLIFICLALNTSFNNAYIKYPDHFRDYVSDCVGVSVINTIISLIVAIILAVFIPGLPKQYTVLLIGGSFAQAVVLFYNSYLSIYYRSGSYVRFTGVQAVANVILSLILILTIFKNNRGYGWIYGKTLPIIFMTFYLIFKLWRTNRPKFRKEYLKFAISFSLPMIPNALAGILLASSDRIMISKMIGISEAGIYSFAYTLSTVVGITLDSLGRVWGPWFYDAFNAERFEDIKRNSGQYIMLISVFIIIIVLICPEATLIMGSAKYQGAVALAVPVMSGIYFSFLGGFSNLIELYYEKTQYIVMGTFLSASINVVLNFICIQKWGYAAAAYTTLVTYCASFVFHSFIAKKLLGSKKIYDKKIFVLSIMFVFATGIFTQIFLDSALPRWIAASIIGIAALIYAFKNYSEQFKHI